MLRAQAGRTAVRVSIIAAAMGMGALTISSGLARVLARPNPGVALSFASYDGIAAARMADAVIRRVPAGADPDEAANYARRALERDPTRADAMRVLGFVADVKRDRALARRLVRGAASLSRRDLPSQLWLIEDRVAAEDVPAALVHYDVALRTSPNAWSMLAPVLVSAWSDPQLAPQIRRMLLLNPPYLPHLISLGASNTEAAPEVGRTIIALRQEGITVNRRESATVIKTLVASGDWAEAVRLYHGVTGARPFGSGNLAIGLKDSNRYPPFDWSVSDQGEVVASQHGAVSLSFVVSISSVFAERTLSLNPGRHLLDVVIDTETVDGRWILGWTARCGGPDGTELGSARVSAAASSEQRLASTIAVPASRCPLIHIAFTATGENGEVRGIVKRARLTR